MYDLKLINGMVYLDGTFVSTNVYVKDGLIARLSTEDIEALDTYDCHGNLVLPGILDPHTHFDLDLGHISSVDDFHSGTKAAAFGGVTTIVDFLQPVNNTLDLIQAFEHRKEQAKNAVIDVKFHACLTEPQDDLNLFTDTMLSYGMNTVKIFTTYSDSNRRTYDKAIQELLKLSASKPFLVAAHIENDEMIVLDATAPYEALPDNRPTLSETSEALKLAGFVKATGGSLYMVHCSSGETLKQLVEQYSDLLHHQLFVETCPHYVTFNRDRLTKEDGYLYTMAPPLRSEKERLTLIQLIDQIDTIGTDHCPFMSTDKHHKKLIDMPLGVDGVESSFRIMHTMFGDAIIDKMTKHVAQIHGLYPQKGVIQEGSDADLFVYHLEPTTIDTFHSKSDYSIYRGMIVDGVVVSTISRGTFVVKDGKYQSHRGTLLHPGGE